MRKNWQIFSILLHSGVVKYICVLQFSVIYFQKVDYILQAQVEKPQLEMSNQSNI